MLGTFSCILSLLNYCHWFAWNADKYKYRILILQWRELEWTPQGGPQSLSPTPPLGGWDHQLVLNLLMIFKQVGIYDLSCNDSLVCYIYAFKCHHWILCHDKHVTKIYLRYTQWQNNLLEFYPTSTCRHSYSLRVCSPYSLAECILQSQII